MATETINYGSRAAFSVVSNLTSLANAAAKPLGAIDNSSNKAIGFKVDLTVTLAGSSVSATGVIRVYLIESEDGGTNYDDGINPSTTSDIASSIKNALLIGTLTANANSQVVRATLDVPVFPRLFAPKHWTLVVLNESGTALHSSGHDAQVTPIKYDAA